MATNVTDYSKAFQIPRKIYYRNPVVEYTVWMDDNLKFDDFNDTFDSLSHITTFENAHNIIHDGFKLQPVKDVSSVKESNHPLHGLSTIWCSPSNVDELPDGDQPHGNVKFSSTKDLYSLIKKKNYYIIEGINFVKRKAIRVLITDSDDYHLKSFNIYDYSGPIYCDKGRELFYKASSYTVDCNKIKSEFDLEILLEDATMFDTVTYTPCNEAKPIISKNEKYILGSIPAFPDSGDGTLLGHLLYCHLYRKNKLHNRFVVKFDIITKSLEKFIEEFDIGEDKVHKERLDEIDTIDVEYQDPNDLLMQIHFEKALTYRGRLQFEDFGTIEMLHYIFVKYNEVPDIETCIQLIQNVPRQKQWTDDHLYVLLSHFTTKAKKILINNLKIFVKKT